MAYYQQQDDPFQDPRLLTGENSKPPPDFSDGAPNAQADAFQSVRDWYAQNPTQPAQQGPLDLSYYAGGGGGDMVAQPVPPTSGWWDKTDPNTGQPYTREGYQNFINHQGDGGASTMIGIAPRGGWQSGNELPQSVRNNPDIMSALGGLGANGLQSLQQGINGMPPGGDRRGALRAALGGSQRLGLDAQGNFPTNPDGTMVSDTGPRGGREPWGPRGAVTPNAPTEAAPAVNPELARLSALPGRRVGQYRKAGLEAPSSPVKPTQAGGTATMGGGKPVGVGGGKPSGNGMDIGGGTTGLPVRSGGKFAQGNQVGAPIDAKMKMPLGDSAAMALARRKKPPVSGAGMI